MPAAVAFALVTLGLGLRQLLYYSEMAASRGLALGELGALFLLECAPMVELALPVAAGIGVLVGIGRMVAQREVLALCTAGVAPIALLRPVMAVAAIVTGASLILTCTVSPLSRRSLDHRIETLARSRPLVALEPGVALVTDDWTVDALEVSRSGAEAHGLIIRSRDGDTLLFAGSGRFVGRGVGATELELREVVTVLDARRGPRVARAGSLRVAIPEDAVTGRGSHAARLRGRESGALFARVRDGEATVAESLELHARLARGVATAVLSLGAFALVVGLGRGGTGPDWPGGIAILAIHYSLLLFGDGLARAGHAPPWLGAWLPNLVVSLLAGGVLWRSSQRRSVPGAEQRTASRADLTRWIPQLVLGWTRSATIGGYVGRRLLGTIALCLGAAIVIQLAIDVLEDLPWTTELDPPLALLASYYMARLPVIVSGALPIVLFAAASITLGSMARDGEILGMMASGISKARILLPVVAVALAFALLHGGLTELVGPVANEQATRLRRMMAGGLDAEDLAVKDFRRAGSVFRIGAVDAERSRARKVSILNLDEQGMPVERVDAAAAVRGEGERWRLIDAFAVRVGSGVPVRSPAPETVELPDHALRLPFHRTLSLLEVRREAAATEAAGFDARWLRVEMWARAASPLATLLIPVIVAWVALVAAPGRGLTASLGMGVVLSAAYVIVTGISIALGHAGWIEPLLSGVTPAALLVVVLVAITRPWRAGWRPLHFARDRGSSGGRGAEPGGASER